MLPGLGEILVVVSVAVFFFSARKLPALGKALGGSLKHFKKGLSGERQERDVTPLPKSKDSEHPSD